MNKTQKILLLLTLLNLIVIFLFPPFDDYSVSSNGNGMFAGFIFFASKGRNMLINQGLLYLEVVVVLINLGILSLLSIETTKQKKGKFNFRKFAMIVVIINLIGILLFPPFEFISNLSKAMIPTFEGFYFIFSHPPYRAIVTPILYLEVIAALINGCLILLAFKDNKPKEMTAQELLAYAAQLKSGEKR